MVLPLFLLLGVLCHLNTSPLYSILSYYWRFYLVLFSELGVLTALNPLLANRLIIGIFAVNYIEFLGLYCHPIKKSLRRIRFWPYSGYINGF